MLFSRVCRDDMSFFPWSCSNNIHQEIQWILHYGLTLMDSLNFPSGFQGHSDHEAPTMLLSKEPTFQYYPRSLLNRSMTLIDF